MFDILNPAYDSQNLELVEIEEVEEIEVGEDEYVYDIEVEHESHAFFANDIWIHNSLFFTYTPILESCEWAGDPNEFILKIYELKIEQMNKDLLTDWAIDNFGLENMHDFELEKIADRGIFLAKKRYVNRLVWEEGLVYDGGQMLYKGIDLVRSECPPFVRDNFERVINYFFDNPKTFNNNDLILIVQDIKEEFISSDIEYISMQTSVSTYDKYIISDENEIRYEKGTPMAVKAAASHNHLLFKNSKYADKYERIKNGDKIKYYPTKNPTIPVFGYLRDKYPIEFASEEVPVDHDKLFNKYFLSLLNRFNEALKLPEVNERLTVIKSLFGFHN